MVVCISAPVGHHPHPSPLPRTGEGIRGPSTGSGRTCFLVVARQLLTARHEGRGAAGFTAEVAESAEGGEGGGCLCLCPGGTSPSPPFCNGAGSSPLPRTGEGISKGLRQAQAERGFLWLHGRYWRPCTGPSAGWGAAQEQEDSPQRSRRAQRGEKGWEWRQLLPLVRFRRGGGHCLRVTGGTPSLYLPPSGGEIVVVCISAPVGHHPHPNPLPRTGEGIRGPSTGSGRTCFLVVARPLHGHEGGALLCPGRGRFTAEVAESAEGGERWEWIRAFGGFCAAMLSCECRK